MLTMNTETLAGNDFAETALEDAFNSSLASAVDDQDFWEFTSREWIYFEYINSVARLDQAGQVELCTRIEAGFFAEEMLAENTDPLDQKTKKDLDWIALDGRRAMDHLMSAHLWLVVGAALLHRHDGISFEALIQVGKETLVASLQTFDYTADVSFPAHAAKRIDRALSNEVLVQAA